MNLLQLTFKQMRQRALATWLTFLSVTLGVALAIAILLLYREGDKLFTQTEFGFDVVVGAKTGGNLNNVLNAVYQMGGAPVTIGYDVYQDLLADDSVRWAVPWAVGDNYEGFRVIGTSPAILGLDETGQPLPSDKTFEYRIGRAFQLAAGRPFHPRKFEAVIGADVAKRTDLRLGSTFKASHGAEAVEGMEDEHDEMWEVVGILQPTQTAMDRVIFIPLISAIAVPSHAKVVQQIADLQATHEDEHEHDHDHADAGDHDAHKDDGDNEDHAGHAHHHDHVYHLEPDGIIDLHIPPEKWRISAVLLRTIGHGRSQEVIFNVNNLPHASAVNPAWEMRRFFDSFLKGSRLLLLTISAMVTIVAAVGILVSIYNSVSARVKEIAILRALGATRLRVLSLICLEAGLIGLIGSVAGLVAGHAAGAVGNIFFERYVGESINYLAFDSSEWGYLAIVVLVAIIAGLVPALKAYKTPVATNLVG